MQIDHVSGQDALHESPEWFVEQANETNFHGSLQRAQEDPQAFWAEWARRFDWSVPFSKVLEWNFPDHSWFGDGQLNIVDNALDRHVREGRGGKTAMTWLGEDGAREELSYIQLTDRVSRMAAALQGLGLGLGDRVILYLPMTLEGAIAMLASARLGAIHSVVYAGLGVGALRERIVDTGAKMVIAGTCTYRRGQRVDLEAIVRQALLECPVESVVWLQRETPRALSAPEYDWNELLQAQTAGVPAVAVPAEHPLYILYTSGSTGKPKGVVHVHGGWMVGVSYHLRTLFDAKDDDVFWSTSDLGWIVGHAFIVYGILLEGLTSVMREGAPDYPSPGQIWQTVEELKVNLMFTAPTAIRMAVRYGEKWPRGCDLSSLRLMAVAGETLNPEANIWAWENVLGEGRTGVLVDNWWQTELGGPTLASPPSLPHRPGKVGVALPGVSAKVVDDQGAEVAAGQGGHLILTTPFPHLMRTIWNNHERYVQYWTELPGQVYATGDLASVEEDGRIAILGRSDDVINTAGHRIGSADVEAALCGHPEVAEAAVVGVPDELKGERIHAYVVLRQGEHDLEKLRGDLVAFARNELGPVSAPSAIEVIAALPKTRSGKIIRRMLRAQLMGEDPGDLSTLEE